MSVIVPCIARNSYVVHDHSDTERPELEKYEYHTGGESPRDAKKATPLGELLAM